MFSDKLSVVKPSTCKPFHMSVDASGLGAILFQANDKTGKTQVISYNSRLLTSSEQRQPIMLKELMAIIFALQAYEFLIIGSEHPKTIFLDHTPLVWLFSTK